MQSMIDKMFANGRGGGFQEVFTLLNCGGYYEAGRILAMYCRRPNVKALQFPKHQFDYQTMARRYLTIAIQLNIWNEYEIGRALWCCAKLALGRRHPADSFKVPKIECSEVVYCMNCLAAGSFENGLWHIGGVARKYTSPEEMKFAVTNRETKDDWKEAIIEAVIRRDWSSVGALAAAAITWEKTNG